MESFKGFSARYPHPLKVTDPGISAEQSKANESAALLELWKQVLTPSEERNRYYLEHPFTTDRAFIATNPIQEAYKEIVTCITHRDSGRCFIANPRTGKTFSIEVLKSALSQVFPNVAIYSINAKSHDGKTEKAFFGDLLEDIGLPFEGNTTATVRRQRIKQNIKAKCSQFHSSMALMFIDESQNWGETELTFLRDITNDLSKFDGILLVAILFAQPEIINTQAKLKSRNRTDLVGRYLRDPLELTGLRNLSDLRAVLEQCDDPMQHEYPPYSGIALTEFFLPQAYLAGWRLNKEASKLWNAILSEVKIKSNEEISIGMAWIMSSIRDFMFQSMKLDSEFFSSEKDMWVTAVRCGRYSYLHN